MDLFNNLEEKLESILSKFESLKEANAALQNNLSLKDQALKEAEAALEKVNQEREVIRQRIDKILKRLEILDKGESA
ncbi:MAG: cell division protein ZapB [Syntrophales bacterium]|nr:cell division protein ZapB [Syntrophales bacterium]MDD5643598.1 cell division protein ZapB [Syntrophales bacterium]